MQPTPTERVSERECTHPRAAGYRIVAVEGGEQTVLCTQCDAAYLEERARLMRYRKSRIQASIPTRFWDCSFDNYNATTEKQRRALAKTREYVNSLDRDSLTLCGLPGTGKTHLACAIANQLLDAEKTVIYTTVLELIRGIRDTWRRDSSESETDVVGKYRKVKLLILDEVGVQFGSEAEKAQLFDVLDGRYREMRPTVIVSNLNSKALQECLGPRIFDRLMETGSTVVLFDWESYRRVPKSPLGAEV
jgi:DNA replication protein DnaC